MKSIAVLKFTDDQLLALASSGATAVAAAKALGVSRQAVQQRAERAGLSEQFWANRPKPKRRTVKLEQRYGLSLAMIRNLQTSGATKAFTQQRANARTRGIDWRMTLREWWAVWDASGKWEQRGCQLGGWVMARYGDMGAYEVGNVYIATHSENAKTAQSHARRPAAAPRLQRHGSGWAVMYRKTYLGFFKRLEDAEMRRQSFAQELLTAP